MNLYELQQEQLELNALLEENGGELTPEIEERLMIHDCDVQQKMESYCKAIKCYENDIAAFKSEIERLKARKESAEKAIERMKDAMTNAMETFGLKKLEAGTFKIGTRKSQSVEILDEDAISSEYKREKITYSVDKVAIKNAIESGVEVEGAKLNENTNITIK